MADPAEDTVDIPAIPTGANVADPAEDTADIPAQPQRLEKLLGRDLDLVAPMSLAERWEVYGSAQDAPDNQVMVRVLAAALGLCWGRFRRNPKAPKYDGRVLAYGGRVIDYCIAGGAKLDEVVTAGGYSLALCRDALVSQEDVDAAEGFSVASTGGSR